MDTKIRGLRSTLTVRRVRVLNSMGFLLSSRKNQSDLRYSSMTNQRLCRCGDAFLCPKSCKGYEVWMSGTRNLPSSVGSFLVTSRRSLSGGVTVFGFTIMASLRTLQEGITCCSSGPRSTSGILTILPSSVKSFFTWLRAKLIPVASVSFILSVAVLATLISVLLFLLTKLRRLKTSFLAFSRRLVKILKRTSS